METPSNKQTFTQYNQINFKISSVSVTDVVKCSDIGEMSRFLFDHKSGVIAIHRKQTTESATRTPQKHCPESLICLIYTAKWSHDRTYLGWVYV